VREGVAGTERKSLPPGLLQAIFSGPNAGNAILACTPLVLAGSAAGLFTGETDLALLSATLGSAVCRGPHRDDAR
jgi:hypothetical protein